MDKTKSFNFFNGARKSRDLIVGLGFVIYISKVHYLKFWANNGKGTNNFGEFNALLYLLNLTSNIQHISLQVNGDSLLTTYWIENTTHIFNNSIFHVLR